MSGTCEVHLKALRPRVASSSSKEIPQRWRQTSARGPKCRCRTLTRPAQPLHCEIFNPAPTSLHSPRFQTSFIKPCSFAPIRLANTANTSMLADADPLPGTPCFCFRVVYADTLPCAEFLTLALEARSLLKSAELALCSPYEKGERFTRQPLPRKMSATKNM